MEKALARIHLALQKFIGLHRQLLEVVRAEREALTQANLSGIEEATRGKEAIVRQVALEESERLKALAEVILSLKKPAHDISLPNLVIAVQGMFPKEAEQLRSDYNALQVLTQRIREQNDYNRELLDRSIEHIQSMKRNVLGEAAPRTETYGAQGQKNTGQAGSRFISQEA